MWNGSPHVEWLGIAADFSYLSMTSGVLRRDRILHFLILVDYLGADFLGTVDLTWRKIHWIHRTQQNQTLK